MTENAWLIEKADNEHPGCVVPGEALGVYDEDAPFLNRKRALWGPYDTALRFARQQDAEAAASVLVPCADTVAVCHAWSDVPTEAPAIKIDYHPAEYIPGMAPRTDATDKGLANRNASEQYIIMRAHARALEIELREANVPVSSGAASAPYAPAAGSEGRCPTCRQRNSRAVERTLDDGSVIVWYCNVQGCSNSADYPNAPREGRRSRTLDADVCPEVTHAER